MNNITTEIQELVSKIRPARQTYYNGSSIVSDKVYDAWIDRLTELDPKNPEIIGIGAEPISNWEKYIHLVPMGSLNKCQTPEEFDHWCGKYFNPKTDQLLLTLKLDGLSVSLVYENGLLTKAASRGGGSAGELITSNVAKMIGVPLRLKEKINATIRGEILLSKENLKVHFSEYSNSRNAASGISRRYDSTGSDKLHVLVYHLITDSVKLETQEQVFTTLQSWGFQVPPFYVLSDQKEAWKYRTKYIEGLREDYPFDLDGLVAHQNDLVKHKAAGSHNQRDYASIAIKFDNIAKEGHVSRIEVQVGNSGRITPVVYFDPKIPLMGAQIEKASLHNFANVRDLGIGVGATVLVSRAQDIIPFVEEVISSPDTVFQPPSHCPECQTELLEKGEYLQCPNTDNCKAQQLGRLLNWLKELDVKEWGEKLLVKVLESGKVNSVADLYLLTAADLENLDRMGKKSAANAIKELHLITEVPLDILIGGLSIPMVGSSTIRAIMTTGFDTLEKLQKMSVYDLESVNGIGSVKAKSLYDGLIANQDLISQLLNNGVKIKMNNDNQMTGGKLNGVSFCFTGKMLHKRSDLEKMATDLGAEIKSVGKGLTYLVSAEEDSGSSKSEKAKKNNVKIISEEDFLEMVQ